MSPELACLVRSLLNCEQQWTAADRDLAARLADALETLDPPLWKPQPGPQTLAYLHPADVTGYGGSAGGGKGLALDTPLPTPAGPTTMGAVRVGDWLLDERGQPCRVIA